MFSTASTGLYWQQGPVGQSEGARNHNHEVMGLKVQVKKAIKKKKKKVIGLYWEHALFANSDCVQWRNSC